MVQCPHCRAITPVALIKTNYALTGLMSGAETNTGPNTDHARCQSHPHQNVSLFCFTCHIFICPECYEIGTSQHSAHVRLPLKEGIEKSAIEVRHLKERVDSLRVFNERILAVESQRVAQATLEIDSTYKAVSDYYHETINRLKDEFDRIGILLNEYRLRIRGNLTVPEQRRSEFEHITRAISKVPTSLQDALDFTSKRREIMCFMENCSLQDSLTNELDQILLNGVSPMNIPAIRVPRIRAMSGRVTNLFEVVEPEDVLPVGTEGQILHKPLLRCTSSDKLSS